MSKPYFYIIEHIKSGKYYAGVRFAKNCNKEELLQENGYYTSSKYVKELIESDGLESFKIRKIKEFDTAKEAMEYETRFLKKVKARNNYMFINKSENAVAKHYLFPDDLKQIMLNKYGVNHYTQTKDYWNSYKLTCLKKYNVNHSFKHDIIKNKIKQTNLKRYGSEYFLQSEIGKKTIKNAIYKKYGVNNVFQSEEIKQKIKETVMQRYGVTHVMYNKQIKEKIRKTNLKRYGVENPLQNEIIREKCKKTCLKKYGVEYSLQSDIVKQKLKETNLRKYGVEYVTQLNFVKEKSKETCLSKYGVDHFFKSEEGKKVLSERQQGAKHWRFKGWFITPSGKYGSAKEALRVHPEYGAGLKDWCRKSNKIISKFNYIHSKFLQETYTYDEVVGIKTFKDIGFDFEEITK